MKKLLFQQTFYSKLLSGAFIGLCIFLFLSMCSIIGLFGTWQNRLSDTLFTQGQAREDIIIIGIDDKSIQELGRWPWERAVHAELLAKLAQAQPKVVGIDISFLENSDQKNDEALVKAIGNLKNTKVVLASEVSESRVLEPIEMLQEVASSGYVNTIPDEDGITRKVNLWTGESSSFAFEIAKIYDQNLSGSQNARINFAGSPGSFKTYSYSDVLNGGVNLDEFRDKIILIGATAPDLHDDQNIPLNGSKMTGVEIQANIIQTILNGDPLTTEDSLITILTIFIISVGLSTILIFVSPVITIIALVAIALLYIIYVIFAFDQGTIRNIIYPLLSLGIVGISNIIYKYLTESKAKKFIRRAFSYYLSESVLQEILEHPEKLKLGGERQNLTVLFSDIAGFTSISEKMEPQELSEMLNKYLTKMTNIVFKYDGVLDKYIGDAVMAFWGAPLKLPNHALSACITALEMQEEMKNFDFSIRIGINSGDVAVGNMGSHQRFDYTLIGDNVNLGSRLEGINKIYGTKIIISEGTYKMVSDKVTARLLDRVAVKGKKEGVAIYELIKLGKPTTKQKMFLTEFEKARILYEKREFKKSLQLFRTFAKKYPSDEPTKMYLQRLQELIADPPEDWDGVYHAKSK